MNRAIFTILKEHADDIYRINRIIINAFLKINQVNEIKNRIIRQHLFCANDPDIPILEEILRHVPSTGMSFENLIELFEYVISPANKVINGAVYTPLEIREHIISNCLMMYNGDISDLKAADISCGCGGFLMTLAQEIYRFSDKSYADIYRENIYGNDIAIYSIERTKILLILFAILNGEDLEEFDFNLFCGDSLVFEWSTICPEVLRQGGFDLIVGNPPYVCSRNMDSNTLKNMKNWEVSRSGHPDLYIPFFQIGLANLNHLGILGYITVNTFIKSVNGRALREYFSKNNTSLSIFSFGGEQIFPERNTYTCICYASRKKGNVKYIRISKGDLENVRISDLNAFEYEYLNHKDGWNLVNDTSTVNFINKIESIGQPFKKLYITRNGIATLKNDVYKFTPTKSDKKYHYLQDGNNEFQIEKKICRNLVNANKIKNEEDIIRLREKIIFPYDKKCNIFPESIMKRDFPMAYNYLLKKKKILATRDKGKKAYEKWYAYGRHQSMDINAYKLFFPHICERPNFVICRDRDLLFYNGIAIVSDNIQDLEVIKKILQSDIFYKYIQNTTKDYSSGYISMSRNYLKNFGIPNMNERQRLTLLNHNNVEEFLLSLYGV